MKSKILKTVGLVAAMVACLSLSVFAAGSPASNGVVSGSTTEGIVIDHAMPAEYQAPAAEIKTEAKLKEVLGSKYNSNMTVVDVVDAYYTGGQLPGPTTITFKVAGVTASTKGFILHYENGAWKVLDTKCGEGTMTATFDSLSPVAFVIEKTTASASAKSPKTSASAASAAAVLGVAALASAYELKKRK